MTEWFDASDASRLTRTSCIGLIRATLDPTTPPPEVPGLRTSRGGLVDLAVAVGATWAAPLLHVTIDVHAGGTVRTVHVHWAASGTVTSELEGGADQVRTVRWHRPEAFARAVVVAAGLHDAPAAETSSELATSRLARDLGDRSGSSRSRLATLTLVAVDHAPSDLSTPAPLPGTEPVSRALVTTGDGLHRVEHRGGDRLRLVPWSGPDEQAWLAQVFTGFRDRLSDGRAR